jgi:type I restriction enzyme S subunit
MQLGDVIRFGNGKSITPGGEGRFPVYGSNGIIGGCDEFRYENAVIIGRVGAYCGSVAYCSDKFWASDNTLVAFPASDEFDTHFLFYLLHETKLSRYAGGAAQPLVTQTVLKQVEVTVPPLPTQKRIASILSAYDELMENNQRRITKLEAMARTLYREWFVRTGKPTAAATGNRISTLGELCELVKQPFAESEHADRPLLDLARMPQRTIAPAETGTASELTTSRILFEPGDTLFGAIRCYLHKVLAAHYPGVTNTSVLVLRPTHPHFRSLVALIASDTATIRWADTHSTGAKMPVINWGVFQTMPAPLPPDAQARQFESIAGPMLDQIGVLANQIQNLRRTRDLLLPRLLSGQVELKTEAA